MFGKLKGAFLGAQQSPQNKQSKKYKYDYTRPHFLGLTTEDELQVCSDHAVRPIMVPRDLNILEWSSGYAETINAGKSRRNEDQACAYSLQLLFQFTADDLTRRVCDMLPELFTRTLRFNDPPQRDFGAYDRLYTPRTNARTSIMLPTPPLNGPLDMIQPAPTIKLKSIAKPDVIASDSEEELPKDVKVVDKAGRSDDSSDDASSDATTARVISSEKKVLKATELVGSDPLLNAANLQDSDNYAPNHTISVSSDIPPSISLQNVALEASDKFVRAPNPMTESVSTPKNISSACMPEQAVTIKGELPFYCFALFDGHAGSDVAVAAANQLHKIIHKKLLNIADLLVAFSSEDDNSNLLSNKYKKQQLNTTPSPTHEQTAINSTDSLWRAIDRIQANTQQDSLNPTPIIQDQMLNSHIRWQGSISPNGNKRVTVDNLITGALESAFWDFDFLVENDKVQYKMIGGCTAIVSLFMLGKLYVANAGDSRAILVKDQKPLQMSFDFTPESERERIKYMGLIRPELLGDEFTYLEFIRRPTLSDVGKSILCRDAYMSGWAYKTVTLKDLKFPVVIGEAKRSRALATIGVTRGFGDHELRAQNTNVLVKPFLTPEPEIRIYDIQNDSTLTEDDVLVMGTDGLWDVTSNEMVASLCAKTFQYFPINEQEDENAQCSSSSSSSGAGDTARSKDRSGKLNFKYRYISAAQDLVMYARGKMKDNNARVWKTVDGTAATMDDISVFVIPLKGYQTANLKWKTKLTLNSQ